MFTKANKFMATFTSEHLCISGRWISQNQRRFILVDSAKEALDGLLNFELNNPLYWPEAFHKWDNLRIYPEPECPEYAYGHYRFYDGMPTDFRQNTCS